MTTDSAVMTDEQITAANAVGFARRLREMEDTVRGLGTFVKGADTSRRRERSRAIDDLDARIVDLSEALDVVKHRVDAVVAQTGVKILSDA